MPKPKISPKPAEELTYEEAFAELETIVAALEDGQNPLEEALRLFERGQALSARCAALLDSARLQVQRLAGDSPLDFNEEDE